MKLASLYMITNRINGKAYVGYSNNVEKRWNKHKSGTGSKLLYSAFQKYGLENFKFEILCENKSLETIKKLEIEAIAREHTIANFGYNLTEGAKVFLAISIQRKAKKRCVRML